MDEEARGRLEPDCSGRDDQVPEGDLRLEGPAGSDPDEGRPFRDRQDLRHRDLDVVRADPGRDDRDPGAAIRPGDRGELPVAPLELDVVETRGDPGGPVGVAGEEDVLGQVTRSESDVVLPFSGREGYAGIRVRQDLVPHSGVLRRRETRPRIGPPSRERQARPRTSRARRDRARRPLRPGGADARRRHVAGAVSDGARRPVRGRGHEARSTRAPRSAGAARGRTGRIGRRATARAIRTATARRCRRSRVRARRRERHRGRSRARRAPADARVIGPAPARADAPVPAPAAAEPRARVTDAAGRALGSRSARGRRRGRSRPGRRRRRRRAIALDRARPGRWR